MKKLNQTLKQLATSNQTGLMMHIVAGYPDLSSSQRLAEEILKSGADILEVQIPFSDPVADGPVIAKANEIALAQGVTVGQSLEMVESLSRDFDKPILIMSYFNIIFRYGVEKFCSKANQIGVQGLIVPDYPFDEDEANLLISSCKRYKLAFVQVIASTTADERMTALVKNASGLIYCMARTGITGHKTTISDHTKAYLGKVRSQSDLPIAVGFGLSDKHQIDTLKPYADVMVIGSALIRQYADKPLEDGLRSVSTFIRGLI